MGKKPRTPVTDRALDELTHADKERVAERDKERLEVERSRLTPEVAAKMTTPTHSIGNMMREWESLITGMEADDWGAGVCFLIDDYLFALDVRAGLGEALNRMQPNTPHSVIEALEVLDRRFLDQTIQEEPGGAGVLEPYVRNMAVRPPDWLWNRRPRVVPW